MTDKKEKRTVLIKADNLVKDFIIGDKCIRILKGLSFEIERGDFVMINGPSGCGKSTLMNIINGWEGPTSGNVYIEGNDLYQLKEKNRVEFMRKYIGMVPQASFWVKSLTALDNIGIPYLLTGKPKRETRERAMELMKILGLEKFHAHKPMDLSGGQQQRVSLLRSLINNPEILMADEPTGNLDSKSSDVLMNLFCTIKWEMGRTIVMVTHNQELLDYATKVIYMKDGEIVKIETKGWPNQLKNDEIGDILELSNKKIIKMAEEEEQEEVERAAIG